MTRIAQSICALAIVGLLPSAAWALAGELPSGPNYCGKLLVVTSNVVATEETVCGQPRELYNVMVVGLGEPAILTTLSTVIDSNLARGDRFNLSDQTFCFATDDMLLAADVLRDVISLGCDPDTGEYLYLADIEW